MNGIIDNVMSQYILQKDTPATKKGCLFEPVYGGELYIGLEKPHESFNKVYVENNIDWFLRKEEKKRGE